MPVITRVPEMAVSFGILMEVRLAFDEIKTDPNTFKRVGKERVPSLVLLLMSR